MSYCVMCGSSQLLEPCRNAPPPPPPSLPNALLLFVVPWHQPNFFDRKYVTTQLRSLGIVQTCELLKSGLPTRVAYDEICDTLSAVAKSKDNKSLFNDTQSLVAALLWAFDVPPDSYRLGRTRVFFRSGKRQRVMRMLTTRMEEQGEVITERLQEALKAQQHARTAAQAVQVLIDQANEELMKLKHLRMQAQQAHDASLARQPELMSARKQADDEINQAGEYCCYVSLVALLPVAPTVSSRACVSLAHSWSFVAAPPCCIIVG